MSRTVMLLAALGTLAVVPVAWADAFDPYITPVLAKAIGSDSVKELKELTPDMIGDNDRVLKNISAAFVIVRTNENRLAKLLVVAARQKVVGADKDIPMLLIERFVTYKDGEEQTILTSGKNVALFPGFRFNLDLGQIVPAELPADLQFVAEGETIARALSARRSCTSSRSRCRTSSRRKAPSWWSARSLRSADFNGTFKLNDDGRRSGKLVLKVEDDGTIGGAYYSDRDGAKYDVYGQIGKPSHSIQFTIKFPRTEQVFNGWLFTGDGKFLAGTSRMQDREAGFIAVREE